MKKRGGLLPHDAYGGVQVERDSSIFLVACYVLSSGLGWLREGAFESCLVVVLR
jgi:hypothetical protein